MTEHNWQLCVRLQKCAHLCELDALAGHVNVVEVYKVCELVVPPDVSVVSGERHQEVHQGHDDQHAGGRGDQEHHLGSLRQLWDQIKIQR